MTLPVILISDNCEVRKQIVLVKLWKLTCLVQP